MKDKITLQEAKDWWNNLPENVKRELYNGNPLIHHNELIFIYESEHPQSSPTEPKVNEPMKLISMTDFVLEQSNIPKNEESEMPWLWAHVNLLEKIEAYAKLLKQPLTLGMFTPTDEGGEPLTAPTYFIDGDPKEFQQRQREYEIALSNVMFEGFYWQCDTICNNGIQTFDTGFDLSKYTIEELIYRVGIRPTLTEAALKIINS